MPRPRVLVIAPSAPHAAIPHAGGVYLRLLCAELERQGHLRVLVPGTRTNREAARKPGVPAGLLLVGLEPGRGRLRGALNRLALNADTLLRTVDPGLPYLPLVVGLLSSPEAREAVRSADVIDLQWSDSIRLVRLLRRLNPTARISGTFHDVVSQGLSRRPAATRRERLLRSARVRWSRRCEAAMVRALDDVVVFSTKDAALLGYPPHRVVRPPLASGEDVAHTPGPPGRGVVLLVSWLARPENERAATWLLERIWPGVRERVPDATLRLVGAQAGPALRALVGSTPGATLAGWVDDLDAEYAAATVCVVPLREGAGVKFKTIEGLLHGVPVVTTSVGAEGVEGEDLFAAVRDDAPGLVDAVVSVLADPAAHQPAADRAQEWARATYGREAFVRAVSTGLRVDAAPG